MLISINLIAKSKPRSSNLWSDGPFNWFHVYVTKILNDAMEHEIRSSKILTHDALMLIDADAGKTVHMGI